MTTEIPFTSLPLDQSDVHYLHGPDSGVQEGVPSGAVTGFEWNDSAAYPGTSRRFWVYVPAQYDAEEPAALMVFLDGQGFLDPEDDVRSAIVLDNLIASGDMPVTIAVFINPGHDPSKGAPKNAWSGSNRSLEYNSLGDRYARFLLEEILPEVEKTYRLSHDPEMRAIGGASSGGIAAFTVAWERPEAFRKVLSTIGSFTNLAGGNAYPSIIRKSERQPLRVYQEDSSGDVDNQFGHWPLANQQVHAALRYMGYDARLDYAEGYGHNSKHGGSLFPEALKWLWRKDAARPVAQLKGDLGGDMSLHRLLIDGEDWQLVAEGLGFADAPCTDAEGNFYFSDMKAPGIFQIAKSGTKSKLIEEPASGLKFGADGELYACQGAKKRLIAIEIATSKIEVVAEDVQPNDLAVTYAGDIYFTETGKKQVTLVKAKTREKIAADVGIAAPNGITLSPDQGTLAISEHGGEFVWTFRIEPDGTLSAKAPYMTMRKPIDPAGEFLFHEAPPLKKAASGDGMTSDTLGRYYVTSAVGVQVFDPTGRLCGVLPKPQADKPLTSCALSGEKREYLYVTNGDKIYRRKLQAMGNVYHQAPR